MTKEYIEREALVRYTEKQEVIIKGGTSIADAMRIQGNVFRRCVETIRAADVVEVKHGEWKKRGNEKKCSRCGFIYYSNNDEWSFCPNCGAKMDGERKEQR